MAQGKANAWGEKIVEGKIIGRNNVVIPPQEVEDLASIGCTNVDIANWFGVTEQAIRYNFSENLTKGRESLKINLRRAMLKNACVNLNAAVQIFLAKNMLGMSDNGMNSDTAKVLPFSDDEDDKASEEQLADMREEYKELNGTE